MERNRRLKRPDCSKKQTSFSGNFPIGSTKSVGSIYYLLIVMNFASHKFRATPELARSKFASCLYETKTKSFRGDVVPAIIAFIVDIYITCSRANILDKNGQILI